MDLNIVIAETAVDAGIVWGGSRFPFSEYPLIIKKCNMLISSNRLC